jgi:hypothetical protein
MTVASNQLASYIPCSVTDEHFSPAPNHHYNHASTGMAAAAQATILLKLIEKKGLLGFTREMREQLADALRAEVLDQDLIEKLLLAAFMRHLEICSKAGIAGSIGEISLTGRCMVPMVQGQVC